MCTLAWREGLYGTVQYSRSRLIRQWLRCQRDIRPPSSVLRPPSSVLHPAWCPPAMASCVGCLAPCSCQVLWIRHTFRPPHGRYGGTAGVNRFLLGRRRHCPDVHINPPSPRSTSSSFPPAILHFFHTQPHTHKVHTQPHTLEVFSPHDYL